MSAPADSNPVALAVIESAIAQIDPAGESEQHYQRLDEAYEEFCQLEEKGAAPDAEAFCARYPEVQSSLARLVRAHQFLVENSELLPEEDEPEWPKAGEELAGFRLLRELGKGAFSRVYQATETAMGDRLVALKVSAGGDAEAAMIGPWDHDGIVSAHSVRRDEASGLWVVCMPYRGSVTLHNVLDHLGVIRSRKAPLQGRHLLEACRDPFAIQTGDPSEKPAPRESTFSDALRQFTLQVAEALAFIHDKGVQHRDIKPSNILLRSDGTPMLLDFNLSAHATRADNRLGGTLLYMAPEQLKASSSEHRSEINLDERADLFSLGVVLHELASGKHPFGPIPFKMPTREMRTLLIERHQQGAESLANACPTIDARLARIIDRCLALDPAARPASAQEIVDFLNRPLPWPRRAARFLTHRPKAVLASLFLLGALGVFLAVQFREQTTQDLLQAGREAFATGRFDQAKHLLNQALHREPENVDALLLRGKTYVRLNDFHSANADFHRTDVLRPDGVSKAWRAYCFQKLREPLAARPLYEAALGDGLETAQVLNNLGALYMEASPVSLELSERKLRDARKENPKLRAISHNLAKLYFKKGLHAPDDQKQKYIQEAVGQIENAYALATEAGEVSTELLADCALLHALAASENPASAVAAVKFVRLAVAKGQDPNRFADKSFDAVRTEVNALLATRPRVEAAASRAVRILEPTAY